MSRRPLWVWLVIVAVVLTVGGFAYLVWTSNPAATSSPADPDPGIHVKMVDLPDGRTVTCVVFDPAGPGGSIDCDFAAASVIFESSRLNDHESAVVARALAEHLESLAAAPRNEGAQT